MKHYASTLLSKVDGIVHGFGTAGVPIERYVDGARVPRTHQVHGNNVHVLDDEPGDIVLNGDAFIASKQKLVCFVRTADCVPILIADRTKLVVGAVHAGWRGTAANTVGAAVAKMIERFGCDPQDVYAAIGPAICKECYEVGNDVTSALVDADLPVSDWARFDEESTHMDLVEANHDLLLRAGIDDRSIDVLNICTSCGDDPLASYRKNGTDVRQVSYIYRDKRLTVSDRGKAGRFVSGIR